MKTIHVYWGSYKTDTNRLQTDRWTRWNQYTPTPTPSQLLGTCNSRKTVTGIKPQEVLVPFHDYCTSIYVIEFFQKTFREFIEQPHQDHISECKITVHLWVADWYHWLPNLPQILHQHRIKRMKEKCFFVVFLCVNIQTPEITRRGSIYIIRW